MSEMETHWRKGMVDCGVPDHMHDGIILYLKDGIEPGNFMRAVLENNLMEAMGAADHINRGRMFNICQFMYSYAPSQSHGSRERVAAWLEARRQKQEAHG